MPLAPSSTPRRIEKVVAYIVRGGDLLVFVHENDDNPVDQSGLQVPAGTCHAGEAPAEAVLREAFEETGLVGLRVLRYLGDADYDVRPRDNAIHHRHFFHLTAAEPVPEQWSHVERDEGAGEPRPFRCYWLPLDCAHVLSAGLGALIGRLFD